MFKPMKINNISKITLTPFCKTLNINEYHFTFSKAWRVLRKKEARIEKGKRKEKDLMKGIKFSLWKILIEISSDVEKRSTPATIEETESILKIDWNVNFTLSFSFLPR